MVGRQSSDNGAGLGSLRPLMGTGKLMLITQLFINALKQEFGPGFEAIPKAAADEISGSA